MDEVKKICEEISSANMAYKSATAHNSGITSARDRVKNLMFTYREPLLRALSEYNTLLLQLEEERENSKMLEDALAEADEENNTLRKKVRELDNEQANPKKRRGKAEAAQIKTLTAVIE